MPLKDLSGKTVYDLEPEDFEKLFCSLCRFYAEDCERSFKSMSICQFLVDSGVWNKLYRKRRK